MVLRFAVDFGFAWGWYNIEFYCVLVRVVGVFSGWWGLVFGLVWCLGRFGLVWWFWQWFSPGFGVAVVLIFYGLV